MKKEITAEAIRKKSYKRKEFNPSEKKQKFHLEPYFYCETDVKEFIKRLKEEFKEYLHYGKGVNDVDYIIDKLAGEMNF